MSNLYYRYASADGATPATTTVQKASSEAVPLPQALPALPFAAAPNPSPGSATAGWDAAAAAASAGQGGPYQLSHAQHGRANPLLNGRPIGQQLGAFSLESPTNLAQDGSIPNAHESILHPSAAAAAATAVSGGPGSTLGTLPSHASSNLVFDPNEFPSLAGPPLPSSTATTNGANIVTANPKTNSSLAQGALLSSTGPVANGLGSSGITSGVPPQGLLQSLNSSLAPQTQHSVSASLGSNIFSDLPRSLPSSDYADLYGLGAFGVSRAKAVDALSASATGSVEFSMQSEDFPALGALGAKQTSSIFGSHPGVRLGQQLQSQPMPLHSQQHTQQQQQQITQQLQGLRSGYSAIGPVYSGNGNAGANTGLGTPAQASGRRIFGNPSVISNGFTPGSFSSNPLHSPSQNSQKVQSLLPPPQQSQAQDQQQGWSPTDNGEDSRLQSLGPGTASGSSQGLFDVSSTSPLGGNAGESVQNHLASLTGAHDIRSAANSMASSSTVGDISPVISSQTEVSQTRTLANGGPASALADVDGTEGDPFSARRLQEHVSVDDDADLSQADRHGMKGLLRILKQTPRNADLFLLSRGLDLTMLGLDLNAPDPLHTAFKSPWDEDQPCVGRDEPEFKLPECYYMQPPALKTSHFSKFQLETLFYIFYNMPGDVLQLLAAVELNNRDWRYHKDLKLWFTRAPGSVPGFERGAYIYFDIPNWERRPFHDANHKFIQGLMTEDELRAARIPAPMPGVQSA